MKQIRDDRDRQQAQVQALTGEVANYKEFTGNSCAQLDSLTSKIKTVEVCFVLCCFPALYIVKLFSFFKIMGFLLQDTCSFQRDQINRLQHQLTVEQEKLKVRKLIF